MIGEVRMIKLIEITEKNYNECMELKYEPKYVGEPENNLAMAYIYRDIVTVYGIYNDDTMVGIVSLIRNNKHNIYSFTDLAIADMYRDKGYGKEAVKCVIGMFKEERKYNSVVIRVYHSNARAIHIYEKYGFSKSGTEGKLNIMKLEI